MTNQYIEREAAKRELLSWAVCMNHPEYLMKDDALHVIDSFPAADVVEVTRCRDCKYHEDTPVIGFEHCCLYDLTMRYNDFCSYGKQKEVLTMTEYIENPLSGKLRGVTYEDGKIIDVHIRDTDDVVKVFVPVRHGRWVEQEKYTFGVMYDCSICGDRILDNGHSWNYCPNCGADMRGSNDEKVWEDKHEAL